MTDNDIRIDPEFQSLIPPPTAEERKGLEASLIADGCINPLVVWWNENILLDGHNRFEFCKAHDIEFEIHEIVLDSRKAAKAWIIKNQMGRRNLTESQRAMLAAELEEIFAGEAKQRQAEQARRNQPQSQKVANLPPLEKAKARDEAAATMGVSPRTVQAAKKVKATGSEKLQQAVRNGEASVSAAAEIASLPKAQQDKAVAGGKDGIVKAAQKARRKHQPKPGTISPHAMKPVRGHSKPTAKTALELSHDPVAAARALMSAFDTDYLRTLVRELTNHLKGD